jgi:2-keto-4-pentenoate hydratase/2-oxohepta-3-ene-1,7-dioic acid hydratase in catechol pathway
MFQGGGDAPFLGVVDAQLCVCAFTDLFPAGRWPAHLPQPESIFALLQDWDASFEALHQGVRERLAGLDARKRPVASLRALAPIPQARQLICTGANYRKHVIDLVAAQGAGAASEGMGVEERRESAARRVDERARNGIPYAFPKLVSSIAGPQDDIVVPADAEQFDWELELGVVIGRQSWRLPLAQAMQAVAGYMIVNDLTRRELVYRPDLKSLGSDWLRAKSGPGFFPMGPLFVPAAFVEPGNLRLRLLLNGETMQDESTSDMLWDVPRQISYISSYARLLPGDVIATGSPAGNGMHHGRFLQPGDVMTGEIEGLGRQVNRLVKEEVR